MSKKGWTTGHSRDQTPGICRGNMTLASLASGLTAELVEKSGTSPVSAPIGLFVEVQAPSRNSLLLESLRCVPQKINRDFGNAKIKLLSTIALMNEGAWVILEHKGGKIKFPNGSQLGIHLDQKNGWLEIRKNGIHAFQQMADVFEEQCTQGTQGMGCIC